LENIFEAYNHAQTQKQQPQPHQPQADNSRKPRRTANDDDGEYIEYEEIK
jgi:hypothetical protein